MVVVGSSVGVVAQKLFGHFFIFIFFSTPKFFFSTPKFIPSLTRPLFGNLSPSVPLLPTTLQGSLILLPFEFVTPVFDQQNKITPSMRRKLTVI